MNENLSTVSRAAGGACVAVLACAVLAWPGAASGAGNDELWEVTSEMNVPGMPPGMGGTTTQVCRDKDPRRDATRGPGREDCKVTGVKQSATRVTMTLSCPQGKTTIDLVYNSSHTRYHGTIRSTGPQGEMTMKTSGRKIGSCDAARARQERAARTAQMQAQVGEAQAAVRANEDQQIQRCNQAAQTMRVEDLGIVAQCRAQPELCQSMRQAQPRVAAACEPKLAQFCERYQTQAGFLQANGDESAARVCGVSPQKVKASLCPQAAKSASLDFLGRFCPVEARPIAEAHCAGRTFTSSEPVDQYTEFCRTVAANADFQRAAPRPSAAPASAGNAAKKEATDSATSEAINQGLNKLKGLFGR